MKHIFLVCCLSPGLEFYFHDLKSDRKVEGEIFGVVMRLKKQKRGGRLEIDFTMIFTFIYETT